VLPLSAFSHHYDRRSYRLDCKACRNANERARRIKAATDPRTVMGRPVADPVRYLLLGVLERAYADLAAFGKPIPAIRRDLVDQDVTDIVTGCDKDARDALRWFDSGDAEYLAEEMDVPAQLVRAELHVRLEAYER